MHIKRLIPLALAAAILPAGAALAAEHNDPLRGWRQQASHDGRQDARDHDRDARRHGDDHDRFGRHDDRRDHDGNRFGRHDHDGRGHDRYTRRDFDRRDHRRDAAWQRHHAAERRGWMARHNDRNDHRGPGFYRAPGQLWNSHR